jgi:hypothetical protein
MNKNKLILEDNSQQFNNLWNLYSKCGFLYPEKENILKAHISDIELVWNIILKNDNELFKVFLYGSENTIGTGCLWKNTTNGWFVQHGIANNIKGLLIIYAHEVKFLIEQENAKSAQIWVQPRNKLVNKICQYATKSIDNKYYFMDTLAYLTWKPTRTNTRNLLQCERYKQEHKNTFQQFIIRTKGVVFLMGEELDDFDMELCQLNDDYQKFGFYRKRYIWLIFDDNNLIAVLLIYLGAIGLNFSFLENRCEIIVSCEANSFQREQIVVISLNIIQQECNSNLLEIPIITDTETAKNLTKHCVKFRRQYMRYVWLKECFREWQSNYISKFSNIFDRKNIKLDKL